LIMSLFAMLKGRRHTHRADNQPLKIAVFAPAENKVTQTFIVAQIERLPFNIIPFYGNELGIKNAEGRHVWFWGYWFNAFTSRIHPRANNVITDWFLVRFLRRIRADAVLAQFGITGSYLSEACRRAEIPLFVHFHGFDAYRHDILAKHCQSYIRMFSTASGIIAVSEPMKKQLIALGARSGRLYKNHYGADPAVFSSAKPDSVGPCFLSVGRFVEKKAPHLAILAFERVTRVIPSAELVMVGEGPLLGPCRRLIEALHLENAVTLLGAQNQEDVAKLMKSSRAFIQHSLVAESGDCEGTPVAIIEAQMSGLPVVATNHAGIPEVVVDGQTGFLVEEADVDAMANAMTKLASDPSLAAALGSAARERALVFFSMRRYITELSQIISNRLESDQDGSNTEADPTDSHA